MAAPSTRSPEPPALSLDDRGMRWHQKEAALHIDRRANLRAVLVPGLLVLGLPALGVYAIRDGSPWAGGSLVVATVLPAAFLAMRIVQRAAVVVDGAGVRWAQSRPRPFEGEWARARIDGLRVLVWPRSRWFEPRQAQVDLRVDGSWRTFAFSGPLRRAERLAEAIGLVTGLSPDRVDQGEPG